MRSARLSTATGAKHPKAEAGHRPVVDRQAFVTGTLGLLAAPLAAGAQLAGKAARVGIAVATDLYYDAFLQRLRELDWVAGQNLVVERRSVRGERTHLAAMFAGLVAVKVDVIVATGPLGIEVAKKTTSAIPIVGLDLESDPVARGFVASLARPGGNVTGIFLDLAEIGGKQLQFLTETMTGLVRVAVLWEPEVGEPQLRATEAAARTIGITLNAYSARRAEEIRPALQRAARERAQALVAEAGSLMAYGPSQPEMFRRAASYVDKILRGVKAKDLPVERPSRFDLVINLKTAKALGLTIPPSLLQRADQLIE
jgi:putative ABC transport system substrate-binding protein